MYRPPKPPTKANKPFPSLQIVSSNMSRVSALENPIKMRFHRPNSQQSKKNKIGSKKQSQQQQSDEKNHCTTAFVTPKSFQNNPKQKKLGLSIQSSIFKIRHLSIHMKKPKQNMQPNKTQIIQIEGQKNYRSQHNKKKSTFFLQDIKPIQFQYHHFQTHPLEDRLYWGYSKTGILKLNKEPLQSKICFVISQCLFEQSLQYQSTIFQLKSICDSIFYSTHATIILKLHSNVNIEAFEQNIKDLHLHHLHYIIWNEQQYKQNTNILSLPTMPNIHNYIILSLIDNGLVDVYHGINNESLRSRDGIKSQFKKTTTNYLYLELMQIQKLMKFVSTLKIQKQHVKQQTSLSYEYQGLSQPLEHLEQHGQHGHQDEMNMFQECKDYKIKYDKNSMVLNSTKKFLLNGVVGEKLCLKQRKIRVQSPKPIQKQKTKSQSQKQVYSLEFCQQYKKKMIQLAKIIYTQSNQLKSFNNQNTTTLQNNFMKLKLPDLVGSVMGMGCAISANTAYQFVGELLRLNSINLKHLIQWRKSFSD